MACSPAHPACNPMYLPGELTYLDLQRELPFPTKMVVVAMPGATLAAAIAASRAGLPTAEKRSYLQARRSFACGLEAAAPRASGCSPACERLPPCAWSQVDDGIEVDGDGLLTRVSGRPFAAGATYSVALPRNLLKGAFDIGPLVAFAAEHKAALHYYLLAHHSLLTACLPPPPTTYYLL